MTVARQLAEFLTATKAADLPPAAIDHAAMLIASTIASAAFGAALQSAAIVRALARERGGRIHRYGSTAGGKCRSPMRHR